AFCCASAAPVTNVRTRPLDTRTARNSVMLESPQEGWGVFGSRNRTARKQRPMELNCSGVRPERIACGPSRKLRPPGRRVQLLRDGKTIAIAPRVDNNAAAFGVVADTFQVSSCPIGSPIRNPVCRPVESDGDSD